MKKDTVKKPVLAKVVTPKVETPAAIININIDKLVDKIEVNTPDLQASMQDIKGQVTDVLVSALSEVESLEPVIDTPAAKKEEEPDIEIELTEEDLKGNTDLVAHDDERILREMFAPYLETYPEEKEFHITSDGQVFLKRNASDALAHQKGLDVLQEVVVYRA